MDPDPYKLWLNKNRIILAQKDIWLLVGYESPHIKSFIIFIFFVVNHDEIKSWWVINSILPIMFFVSDTFLHGELRHVSRYKLC